MTGLKALEGLVWRKLEWSWRRRGLLLSIAVTSTFQSVARGVTLQEKKSYVSPLVITTPKWMMGDVHVPEFRDFLFV